MVQEWKPEGYQVTEEDANGDIEGMVGRMGVSFPDFLKANPGQTVPPPVGTMLINPAKKLLEGVGNIAGSYVAKEIKQGQQMGIFQQGLGPSQEFSVGEREKFDAVEQKYHIDAKFQKGLGDGGMSAAGYGASQAQIANSMRTSAETLKGKLDAAFEAATYTGQPDFSNIGVISVSDMQNYNRIYGTDAKGNPIMNAQTLTEQGFTYDGAGNWVPPGGAGATGGGATGGGATGPNTVGGKRFVPAGQRMWGGSTVSAGITRSGRQKYWKRKKNGKWEVKRVRSRAERGKRWARSARNRRRAMANTQPVVSAPGSPVNVLDLRLGSG